MILPDFVLPSRANQLLLQSGIDSEEHCKDLDYFYSYPHQVEYRYNSRGYRDHEWPDTIEELARCFWCVGDSFTVGIGSPLEHTWPYILQQKTNMRTINVSMDGASNNWIARKTLRILQEVSPKLIVLQWSYVSRRELDYELVLDKMWSKFYQNIKDPSWPDCDRQDMHTLPATILEEIELVHGWNRTQVDDEDRRMYASPCHERDDIQNLLSCIDLVDTNKGTTKIIHSFIPEFVSLKFQGQVESQIKGLVVPEIKVLDWARDRHHYDIVTSSKFIDQLVQLLN